MMKVLFIFYTISHLFVSVPWRTQPRRLGRSEPSRKRPSLFFLRFIPLKNMLVANGLLCTLSSTWSCLLYPKGPLTLYLCLFHGGGKKSPFPKMGPSFYLSR